MRRPPPLIGMKSDESPAIWDIEGKRQKTFSYARNCGKAVRTLHNSLRNPISRETADDGASQEVAKFEKAFLDEGAAAEAGEKFRTAHTRITQESFRKFYR